MTRAALIFLCGLCLWGTVAMGQATATETVRVGPLTGLLTLDQDLMFSRSAYGKALIQKLEADAQVLRQEDRRIEAALEQEERDLTARRASMTREEFAPLADEFNQKAEGIRAAQIAKDRQLKETFDAERARFYDAARPVLAQLMADRGAVAIIDKRAIFAGFDNIDITAAAVERLDAVFAASAPATPTP
jgi:Skp family chaperone for outer membrane proteins